MTQRLWKPASSAARAMSASLEAMRAGPSGQVKLGICRPTFIARFYIIKSIA